MKKTISLVLSVLVPPDALFSLDPVLWRQAWRNELSRARLFLSLSWKLIHCPMNQLQSFVSPRPPQTEPSLGCSETLAHNEPDFFRHFDNLRLPHMYMIKYNAMSPPSSTQESSGQNFDVLSRDTLLLRCKLCLGRETYPRLTPEEWLPCCVHHQTHLPTARSAEWGTGSAGVSDHPLHPLPISVIP